jgi:hypothetical protein
MNCEVVVQPRVNMPLRPVDWAAAKTRPWMTMPNDSTRGKVSGEDTNVKPDVLRV